jgi:hypothetical protein
MDILSGMVVLFVVVVAIRGVIGGQATRGIDVIAAAFVPYRDPGWPRGVQEEDPIPWSRSAPAQPDPVDHPVAPRSRTVELVEMEHGPGIALQHVDRGPLRLHRR